MNASMRISRKIDMKALLSTLWVVVLISMMKADILSLYIPGSAQELAKTAVESGASVQQLMLGGAIVGELALAMVILSRLLNYGVNRWVNIIMGILVIAYIWCGAAPYPHYIFIASVETLFLLLVIWNAIQWRNVEA